MPANLQQQGYKLGNNVRNAQAPFDQSQALASQMAGMNIGNQQPMNPQMNMNNPNVNLDNTANNPGQGGDNSNSDGAMFNPNEMSNLARMDKDERKQTIGEKLYPMVQKIVKADDEAGKITGMLLELDLSDLLAMMDPDGKETLNNKINEAHRVYTESLQAVN